MKCIEKNELIRGEWYVGETMYTWLFQFHYYNYKEDECWHYCAYDMISSFIHDGGGFIRNPKNIRKANSVELMKYKIYKQENYEIY